MKLVIREHISPTCNSSDKEPCRNRISQPGKQTKTPAKMVPKVDEIAHQQGSFFSEEKLHVDEKPACPLNYFQTKKKCA